MSWIEPINIPHVGVEIRPPVNDPESGYRRYAGNPYGRGGCPIDFDGKHYESINAAARTIGVTKEKMLRMLGRKKR